MQTATSYMLRQRPKICCSTRATFTPVLNVWMTGAIVITDIHPTIFEPPAMLLCCHLDREDTESHRELLRQTMPRNTACTTNSIWMTDLRHQSHAASLQLKREQPAEIKQWQTLGKICRRTCSIRAKHCWPLFINSYDHKLLKLSVQKLTTRC